ncbi:MAG: dockerin type I domain-containing protein [Armatimonadota bacterium]
MQSTLFYPPLVAWAALSLCLLLPPLQAQDLHFTLLNGDCDGDNEVTLLDFGIVVNAFGSTPNDPNWDPRADLDGDLEVTLFDYGIVVRNFGAIGAEPFDPALPRQPAPDEGYALPGFIELEDWLGSSQPVRIEALREDDPEQRVYWMEVQSSEPFTLHLPQSGLWWVKVSGMPHALKAQRSAKKAYSKGDAVQVIVVYPSQEALPEGTVQYEKFGDGSVDDKPIPIHIHAFDYDDVTYTSSDGNVELKNREREKPSRLRAQWEIVNGGGSFAFLNPLGFDTAYIPPSLGAGESSRQVKLRCKIWDENVTDPPRRDGNPDAIPPVPAAVTDVEFTLVKDPTIATIDCQAISDDGSAVSSAPIASGAASTDCVRLRFTFSARRNKTVWELYEVQWQVPWPGTASGDKGEIFTTEPIQPSEPHDFFNVTVSATFRRLKPILPPPPEPEYEYVRDTKTRRFPLCFSKTDHDEWQNIFRGISFMGERNPPNWFDAKPGHDGHWGHVLEGFDGIDPNLAGQYVVYYAPDAPTAVRNWHAMFDWRGVCAPPGHEHSLGYRGRIYLFGGRITQPSDEAPLEYPSFLSAGGIDHVGRVVAHESAHRKLWLLPNNWEGFTEDKIGIPGWFFPGNSTAETGTGPPDEFYDRDGDGVRDRYEKTSAAERYHFAAPDHTLRFPNLDALYRYILPFTYSIARWWFGDQTIKNSAYIDIEMHAYLWGEWGEANTPFSGFRIGSKDADDWSVGGRNDY